MRRLSLVVSVLGLAGCFAPTTPAARLEEVAQEMKMASRFGQIELALGHVSPGARDAYAKRHAVWQTRARFVDVALVGIDVVAAEEADVSLDVLWLAEGEATVRRTRIVQRWRDDRGTWLLLTERPGEGDAALFALAERPARPAPPDAPPPHPALARPRTLERSEEVY